MIGVKPAYAQNFVIAKGLGKMATPDVLKQAGPPVRHGRMRTRLARSLTMRSMRGAAPEHTSTRFSLCSGAGGSRQGRGPRSGYCGQGGGGGAQGQAGGGRRARSRTRSRALILGRLFGLTLAQTQTRTLTLTLALTRTLTRTRTLTLTLSLARSSARRAQ